jgi:hypothetical protein
MDWRVRFQLILSILTTALFLGLVVWAVAIRNSLLITAVALLFFIVNASILYRTILFVRRIGKKIP